MNLSEVKVKDLNESELSELKNHLKTVSKQTKKEFVIQVMDNELSLTGENEKITNFLREIDNKKINKKIRKEIEPDTYNLFELSNIVKELKKEVKKLKKEVKKLKKV